MTPGHYGALAAVEAALAQQPDVLEETRDGKLQAAGAVIGVVMKSMGCKADAPHVTELVLEQAQSAWGILARSQVGLEREPRAAETKARR